MDDDTTERLAYGLITNVYKAKDIRTAEAAKVIENIRRDLNIALMNELAIIFHKMHLDKLFCKQKPLLKNAYAIFCFAKRNISLVKFLKLFKRKVFMGLTYKENVPDTRESPVKEIVKELKEFGVEAYGYDPLLSKEEIEGFGVKALDELDMKIKMDGVIAAVAHDEF